MAEANTRPLLPTSAKAVSVFAAASTKGATKTIAPQSVLSKSIEANSGPEAVPSVPSETPEPGTTRSASAVEAASLSTTTTTSQDKHSINSSARLSGYRNSTSDHYNQQQQQQRQRQDTIGTCNNSRSSSRQVMTAGSGGGGGSSSGSKPQLPPRQPNRQLSGSSIDSSQSTASPRASVQHQSSMASSASSFASSFVSSDTIASNLRKMIASSSASISRKLNITASSIGSISGASSNSSAPSPIASPSATTSVATSPLPPAATTMVNVAASGSRGLGNGQRELAHEQTQPQVPASLCSNEQRTETLAEFEARQANYRHPVIQCDPSSPASSRPKSSMANRSPLSRSPTETNQQQQQQQQHQQSQKLQANSGDTTICQPGSSLIAVVGREPRPGNDSSAPIGANDQELEMKWPLLTTGGGLATRSAPPLQYFKIQRPWVACLERNKRMWRERSLLEGHKE